MGIYCNTWKLDININKSKIMVFNKAGRMKNHIFSLNGNIMECVRNYKYLGIMFSLNGSFVEAQKHLSDKATKSTFSLKSNLHGENLAPKVAIDLFNKLILPIGTYGSEIWGAYINVSKAKDMENAIFEKVFVNYSKFILGVNRKACNAGVRGELGIFPIYIQIITNVIKYYNRLSQVPKHTLLGEAFDINIEMDAGGMSNWLSKLKQFCNKVLKKDVNVILNMSINDFQDLCRDIYQVHWRGLVANKGKMELYGKIKTNICHEEYLNQLPFFKSRQSLTKLRISAHTLEIERGRYKRPIIPRENRLCNVCNIVDNEVHFLLHCKIHVEIRKNLISEVIDSCKHFVHLSDIDKVSFLLNSEGEVLVKCANFCKAAFEQRENV